MTDDLRDVPVIERATKAEKIINDAVFQDAFDKVRLALLDKIEGSPVRDKDGREYLYLMLKALSDAKGVLEQAMRDGKVALHLREQKRRFQLFG